MKWALIYVLASGIWDTGLRYPHYKACWDDAQMVTKAHLPNEVRLLTKYVDDSTKEGGPMTPDYGKRLKNSFIADNLRFISELEKTFRCMPAKK